MYELAWSNGEHSGLRIQILRVQTPIEVTISQSPNWELFCRFSTEYIFSVKAERNRNWHPPSFVAPRNDSMLTTDYLACIMATSYCTFSFLTAWRSGRYGFASIYYLNYFFIIIQTF